MKNTLSKLLDRFDGEKMVSGKALVDNFGDGVGKTVEAYKDLFGMGDMLKSLSQQPCRF